MVHKSMHRDLRSFRVFVSSDMWDAEHERPFSCIDPATASKLLCTTRIKGIMPKGVEVELELLGVKGTSQIVLFA